MKYIYVRNGMYIKVGNWASNQMLHNRRFDDSHASIKSTVAQASYQRLCERWIDDCTIVKSTVGQGPNQRLYKRTLVQQSNRRLYWLFLKKRIKIFRCPFSAKVVLWMFPALCQVFMCETVLIFPNIYIIHKRNWNILV